MSKKFALIFILATSIFSCQVAFAMKQIPFPDAKSLQPMPSSDVEPNISGNINSGPKNIYNKTNSEIYSDEGITPDATAGVNSQTSSTSDEEVPDLAQPEETTHFVAYTIIIVLLIAGTIFMLKRKGGDLVDY